MRKFLLSFASLLFAASSYGQSTANASLSLQACQGDTIVFSFDITSPYNVGNTFSVEMSNSSGAFAGNFVSVSPLLAYGVSTGNDIDVLIPDNTAQGVYSFRLVSSNPVRISDTISNVIIGANPNTGIVAYNWWDKNGVITFCEGDTAILVANAPPAGQSYTYQWLQGGAPMAGETDDSLLVIASGAYAIEVSSNLCDATSNDTIANTYSPGAEVFANGGAGISYIGIDSIQMCEGTIATLEHFGFPSPGITGYKYQWLKDDSVNIFGQPVMYPLIGDTLPTIDVDTTGTWYLVVTSDPGGCSDTSDVFHVFVDTIPSTTVDVGMWSYQSFPSTTLCLTDSVMLMAQDTVLNSTWEYQWQVAYPSGSGNWQNLPNDTLPWLLVDTSIVADTADYRLSIINETCSYITNETTIEFVNFPTLAIMPGDSLGICVYDSVLVSLVSNGLSFSWNGGLWVGKQNFLSSPGQYVIAASGINGCKTYDTLDIYNYAVVATATASPQIISPGDNTTLSATGGTSFYWFADAPSTFSNQHGASTLALPTADTTTYFIQVEDINGCTDTASVQVFVSEQDSAVIYANTYGNLQNVITPNGDGMNDVLDLSGITNGDPCEFTVYTRWGTPVYNQEVYNNAWGGTTDGGAKLEDGTYYFVLTHNNAIRVKSAVTVLNNI
ncbi:MAG: gliding motility-associated C-terminal domain-containing protein [Schleiferiaceae bacterium]|jgi:gliding motility-associated-like protein